MLNSDGKFSDTVILLKSHCWHADKNLPLEDWKDHFPLGFLTGIHWETVSLEFQPFVNTVISPPNSVIRLFKPIGGLVPNKRLFKELLNVTFLPTMFSYHLY